MEKKEDIKKEIKEEMVEDQDEIERSWKKMQQLMVKKWRKI